MTDTNKPPDKPLRRYYGLLAPPRRIGEEAKLDELEEQVTALNVFAANRDPTVTGGKRKTPTPKWRARTLGFFLRTNAHPDGPAAAIELLQVEQEREAKVLEKESRREEEAARREKRSVTKSTPAEWADLPEPRTLYDVLPDLLEQLAEIRKQLAKK
jgi:hypothetical protein